jgi:arginyl-tRNA synthetase
MSSGSPFALLSAVLAEHAETVSGVAPPPIPLGPPAERSMGDLASPVAMALAKPAKRSPRDLAEEIAAALRADDRTAALVGDIDVAGPGFLNLTLSTRYFADLVRSMGFEGARRGAGGADTPESILLEYVSANPTGPPHVGHARHAAYGDSLARILRFVGHSVEREYYVNDWGRQMRAFGASIAARYAQDGGLDVEVPEDGYGGQYIRALATEIRGEVGDRFDDALGERGLGADEAIGYFAERGGELMLTRIVEDLTAFRAEFDTFFSEASLHAGGTVASGVAALRKSGDAYEADGALWFRTSAYGDEKDRVLVRSDGDSTYLAADVAYHLDKAAREHDRLIDVLGADHHGYVPRLEAVIAAGGHDPDVLEVQIMQLVSLIEKGEAAKMSKRAGTIVTLSDLVDDIGVDAARFFLVQRSHDTAFDLDLDLAREQSQENPVYYVQYAHARCCSILAEVGEVSSAELPEALEESERALALRLAEWPTALGEAEERRAPHRVVSYLIDLARDFHAFYHRCRVKDEPPPVAAFRADLVRVVRDTVALGLDLLGVSAPERM